MHTYACMYMLTHIYTMQMESSLHTIFRLFKSLIMLNEPSLIELCLSDEHVYDTMGILERKFIYKCINVCACVFIYRYDMPIR